MVEKIRLISNPGWNAGGGRTGLTPDVVGDSPGNGGVVQGLNDPAQVALPALRAAVRCQALRLAVGVPRLPALPL